MLLRLLLVDDEDPMLEILQRFLDPITSFIDKAHSLHEAMEKARTGFFNVIVLDLRLGVTGKEEALTAVREFKKHHAEVVVISGLPDPNLKEDCLKAGASAFVAKDAGFTSQALLVATNIATLKLPKESYRSESYLQHVALLHNLTHPTAA